MIKLKNLWKIALATMAMSAMLVACDTTSDSGNKNDDSGLGLTGVYSYTVNLTDIATAWGNSANSPTFSVVFLDETTLETVKKEGDLKKNPASHAEYQIGAFGNMKVADKIEEGDEGNFAVYGAAPVDDVYKYYDGVAVTITDTDLTVFVDTAKLVKTQLKKLFKDEGDGDEAEMTDKHIVKLAGYKPYVLALASEATDPDNKVASGFSADLMKMEEGAKFPAGDLKKDAPVVLGFDDVTTIAGSLEGWKNATALTNGSYTFTYETSLHQINEGTDTKTIQFKFTNGTWDLGFCGGAKITALGVDVEMAEGGNNIELPVSLLEVGKSYTITITKVDKHNGKVKVSAN